MATTDDIGPRRGAPSSNAVHRGRMALEQVFPKLPPVVWIYLITVVTPVSFSLGPLAMTGMRLFLMIMIIPMAINLLAGKYGRTLLTDYLFAAHVVWMIPVYLANNPSSMVQQVGSVGIEFLGGYLVGRAYIRTPEAFLGLAKALVVLVFLMVPLALVETVTGNPIVIEFLERLPGITSALNVTTAGRLGLERVQAVFSHPIHYGLFCSVAFSMCMVALRDQISTPRRYISSLIVVLSGFLALSSGALLAIVLQAALILWAVMLRNVDSRWKILVGLLVFFYVAIDLASNRQPIDVFMSYATFSAHSAYWRSIIFEWGMKSVWNYPLFGIGQNDWVRPWFMRSPSVDNYWLLMAMRFGIPGFLLVAAGYVMGLYRVMRRDFEHDPVLSKIRLAWVFTFLGLSFTLCTVHVWTYIYSFVFFMYGAGLFLIFVDGTGPAEAVEPQAGETRASRFARARPADAQAGVQAAPRPVPQHSRAGQADAPRPTLSRTAQGPAPRRAARSARDPGDGPRFTRFPKTPDG